MMADGDTFSLTDTFVISPLFYTPGITINCGKSNSLFKFEPLEDISTFELSKIMILLLNLVGSSSLFDVTSYMTEFKLERHFQKI